MDRQHRSDRDLLRQFRYEIIVLLLKVKKDVNKLNRRIITMAATVQDLQDAIATIGTQIDGIATKLVDFAADFAAAIKKLQDDVAAGANLDAAVASLAAMSPKLSALASTLSDLDTTAENISGNPTP